MNYLTGRIKEPSTWLHLVVFFTVLFGIQLSPEMQGEIAGWIVLAINFLGMATPDKGE